MLIDSLAVTAPMRKSIETIGLIVLIFCMLIAVNACQPTDASNKSQVINDSSSDNSESSNEDASGDSTGDDNGSGQIFPEKKDLIDYNISSIAIGEPFTNVTITSISDNEQSDLPITFGQVFAKGAIAQGTKVMARLGDGDRRVIPTQVDVKATHDDGSLRHAVFTIRLQILEANGNQIVELIAVDSVPDSEPPVSLVGLSQANFEASVSITTSNDKYTSNANALLKNSMATWLKGNLVTEFHSPGAFINNDGNEHPHLHTRYNIRSYSGFDAIRVDVIVENNWSYQPNPQNFAYDVKITVCDGVYDYKELVHYHHARWRMTFWCGTEPLVTVKHNIDTLVDSAAVPNYDRSLVIPETDLATMAENWSGSKTLPMGIGEARAYMPAGGARPGLGPLPRWAARYLLSQDSRAKMVTMGTANLAGSWSIHYRDKATNLPLSIDDYPYVTLLCRFSNTRNRETGEYEGFPELVGENATPYTADGAHQPDFVYLPYIVSGDHYYLEELQFWANYNMIKACPGGRGHNLGLLRSDQIRGQAWTLRTLAQTAYITPDDATLKNYFLNKVANNLEWYNNEYTNNPDANSLGVIVSGTKSNSATIGPWQDDFFTWSIGHMVELGFDEAIPLLTWKSQFPIGRIIDAEYCWIFGSEYNLKIREDSSSPMYSTLAEVYQASIETALQSLPCASQEMADALGLPLNSMVGFAHSATGYPSNLQPALAVTLDAGVAQSEDAWTIFSSRSVFPRGSNSYEHYPNYAIIPRK